MASASFGLADPTSVAPVLVTAVAATVVTDGAASVVNDSNCPKLVPSELEAMAQ